MTRLGATCCSSRGTQHAYTIFLHSFNNKFMSLQ